MKKIYSTPFQEVIDVELGSFVAESNLGANNTLGNGVQLTKGKVDMDDLWGDDGESSGDWDPSW